MKISFIEPHLGIFGGIRRIVELANRLTARGHDVTIYHSDGSPCSWMPCIAAIKPASAVVDTKHDVVIFNDPNPTDYNLARRAHAKLKIFYVLELYDRSLLKRVHPRICLPGYRRALFMRASLLSSYVKLSNASWLAQWLCEHLGIESHLLLGGINIDMFYPVKVERDSRAFRILCSGDPRPRKGTETVVEAVRLARREEPTIVLDTYYGKGIPQTDMAKTYSKADLFLDAQLQAGWNNPVAEAMACKVPVVCTDIGGVQDFAFHEETALLVPPGDAQAMSRAIIRLMHDNILREQLRENAYQQITEFSWNKSAERLEQILEDELLSEWPNSVRLRTHVTNQVLIQLSNAILLLFKIARFLVRRMPQLAQTNE